ncbi:MAG: hybrid sensor histidine kinase/response regulator [bacterium]|nr:hybrid sensor histidine kinase/response regulator [bacterium]
MFFWVSLVPLQALPETPRLDLDSGWEYRWGDSPFKEGRPLWTQNPDPQAWTPIDFPSNPLQRDGRTNVWYRILLPERPDLGSSLFVLSIDLIAEVYFEDQKIYEYGTFAADGTGKFEGWPWHLIPLPRHYPGHYLYFRVYSDYPDIGLWGEVTLGNEGGHIQKIIQNDLASASVGLFFIFFGLLLLGLALYRLSGGVFLMGLFLVDLGVMPIHGTHLKQLIYFDPLGWQYVGALSYFFLPVAMAALVQVLTGAGKWKLHARVWQLHLAFLGYALIFSWAGWVNLSSTYIHFDLLATATLLALTLSLHLRARMGSFNQKLLALGFWVMYLILLYNGLVAHDLLPFTPSSEYVGPIFLAFCFGLIMLRDYNSLRQGLKARTRQLEDLNQNLELKVSERTEALQRSNETKDKFFSIIAHDLRGPVSSLATLFNQVFKTPADLDQLTFNSIAQTTRNTAELLDNLLTWSSNQSGQMEFHPATFRLSESVAEAIEGLGSQGAVKQIQVVFEEMTEDWVFGDRNMIATVVRNLLGNAIKFTADGGRVEIRLSFEGNWVQLLVSDNGVGIEPATLNQLFVPEVKPATRLGTRKEKGTGLGLLLCTEFVRRNGGKLWADSTPGQGSQFYLQLPRGKSPTAEAPGILKTLPKGFQRFLLVEDNGLHQRAVTHLMQELQGQVWVVSNGTEALARVSKQVVDLVLMDIDLPGMNGIETTKQLRALYPHLRVVALSSYSRQEILEISPVDPFDGYLGKPLESGPFLRLLADLAAP